MTTTDAAVLAPPRPPLLAVLMGGKTVPVLIVCAVLVVVWYLGAIWLNAPMQIDRFERAKVEWTASDLVRETWAQERPLLPAPHQVLVEMNKTIFGKKITSKRSLVYHSWVTLSSTLLGFAIGTALGILRAVGIVHNMTLEQSLMPWIISSQTIPILAIAPMIIVVLGAIGLKGLVPKAIISTYLCFFPVAIAISLVGAIVGELPTGAQAGLGARLLAGSYYGQTIQIWSALLTAAVLAALMVTLIGLIERLVLNRMGMRR